MKTHIFIAMLAWIAGQTSVQPVPCNKPVQNMMVFPRGDGGAQFVPPASLAAGEGNGASAGRKSITVCSSRKNLGTPLFSCRFDMDGGWPTTATGAGSLPTMTLAVGDCFTMALPSGQPVRCIADTGDAGLEVTECR